MTKDEALTMALELIKATNASSQFWLVPNSNLNKTVTAIKEALAQPEQYSDLISNGGLDPRNKFDAQPEQEPVATINDLRNSKMFTLEANGYSRKDPLYTSPPKRQPLTLEEIDALDFRAINAGPDSQYSVRFARAIEAKLKEKNA